MTRARALKQAIRARAAKTGERYTTARRHVLASRAANTPVASARTPEMPARGKEPSAGRDTKRARPDPSLTKGAVTDAKSREKTGHGLDHWFAVLDRFGGVARGHSALARHLYDDHGVPGWYAQGITVAFERARGARTLNQRMSGEYEVSVSKTVGADARAVVRAITDARARRRWLAPSDPALGKALAAALTSQPSKGFVIRPDGLARFRYKWGDTTVQFYVTPRPNGKASVVVSQMKLADQAALEARRAEWRVALDALARVLTP